MSKVCVYFESYLVGGLDTFAVQLINNWSQEDEVTFMCNASHPGAKFFEEKINNPKCKIEIHRMPMYRDFSMKIKNPFLAKCVLVISYWLLVPYYLLFSYNYLRLNRFDYLHVINGGYPACLSSRCVSISWWRNTRKKTIHNFHNFAVKSHPCFRLIDFYLDKCLIKTSSLFVGVSNCCAKSLYNRKVFSGLTNLTYIYNGIDDKIIEPTFNLRQEYNIPTHATILMMLATYEERKGHKLIIKVLDQLLKKNTDTYLFFLGYGSQAEVSYVEKFAMQLGISNRVICLGYKRNAMEFLSQTDFLMIGSQEFESFGLSSIEAMKYKKIVISTNVGGLKEVIVNGEGGFLFDADDYVGMANKIEEIQNNCEMKAIIQEKGYNRYYKYFSVSRMSFEYNKLLKINC